MINDIIIDWPGRSGASYCYWVLSEPKNPAAIKDEGGNYAFVKQLASGLFVPLRFGETNSLRTRIPGHECWAEALRLGATHVMTHTTPTGYWVRLSEERDLIERWNPPLNKQHRTTG